MSGNHLYELVGIFIGIVPGFALGMYWPRIFGTLSKLTEQPEPTPWTVESIAAQNAKLKILDAEKRRKVFRARRSDWDSYAAYYEKQHGPNKDLNPVEQAGIEALRRAKEQHQ